jgi:hypothetical protein
LTNINFRLPPKYNIGIVNTDWLFEESISSKYARIYNHLQGMMALLARQGIPEGMTLSFEYDIRYTNRVNTGERTRIVLSRMARTSNGVISSHILASGFAQNTSKKFGAYQSDIRSSHSSAVNVNLANDGQFSDTGATPPIYPITDASNVSLVSPLPSSVDGNHYTQADAPSYNDIPGGSKVGSEDRDERSRTPRPTSSASTYSRNGVSTDIASPHSQGANLSGAAYTLANPNAYSVSTFGNSNPVTNTDVEFCGRSGLMIPFTIPETTSYKTF